MSFLFKWVLPTHPTEAHGLIASAGSEDLIVNFHFPMTKRIYDEHKTEIKKVHDEHKEEVVKKYQRLV